MNSNGIDYDQGLQQLTIMFPRLDKELIITILENNNNQIEPSIDMLLKLSSETYGITDEKKDDGMISMFNKKPQQNIIESQIKSIPIKESKVEKNIKQVKSQEANGFEDKRYSGSINDIKQNNNSYSNSSKNVKTEEKNKKGFGDKMKSKLYYLCI